MTDIDIYQSIPVEDLWVYDKLILSKKLGHLSGPAGVPVPKHGWYMVRPITNVRGLGACSSKQFLTPDNYNIPPGYFWQEYFEGIHRSVDYHGHKYAFTVKAIKEDGMFKVWKKENYIPDLPQELEYLVKKKYYLNVEFIGNKVIEVHFRYNPDFYNTDRSKLEVVYEPEQIKTSFVLDEDDADGYAKRRLGFNVLQ